MDIYNLYPLIVPSTYYSKDVWDLPHQAFPNKSYILTWVYFRTEDSMTYIKREEFDQLNIQVPNWQQISFENLRLLTEIDGVFFNEFRVDPDTNTLSFILFLNPDGLGSSRILFIDELTKGFAGDFEVCIPDRFCGIAVSKSISVSERRILDEIIDEKYGCSGTAMSKSLFSPTVFELPSSWSKPIDQELSDWMIEQIKSYGD